MEAWMLVTAAGVLVLPYVLMLVFNGRDRSDSRGRRIDTSWHVRRKI